jgi:CubicO group peptidase (beta-lactamase class C family)
MKLISCLLLLLLLFRLPASGQVVPDGEWQTASPEHAGLSSAKLNELFSYIREHHTRVHSIQIVRHGYLVLDAYFYPYDATSRHYIASVTKSVVSTLAGIAIDKGLIRSTDQSIHDFFPLADDAKQGITIDNLLTMRSGFDCGATMSDPNVNLDLRLAEIRRCPDWIKCVLGLPVSTKPGTQFAYCNANCHLISTIISMSAGQSTFEFAKKQLFDPLKIKDVYWPSDPQGVNYGWADIQLHPKDMLKIGQMILQKGKWNNKQIVSTDWLTKATRPRVTDTGSHDQYGYYWWLPGGDYPDVAEAVGRGGQRITVWPSKDMVIVFTGGGFETSDLIGFIVKAIVSDKALSEDMKSMDRLKENISSVSRPPLPITTSMLPKTAASISGKTYNVDVNTLGLKDIKITFSGTNESQLTMTWNGQKVICNIGLDSVPRFSMNPIVRLKQAGTGHWDDDRTFSMNLDLAGAINNYDFIFRFSEDLKSVEVQVSEGTGLNKEKFKGAQLTKSFD